jgi:acyl-ACP thioesterase
MNGRAVTITHHVALGDVRPDATMRLDAIARLVQDVADADAADAPVEGMGFWILRRLDLTIAHTPRFRADLTARTWCSGFGARWAERRTDICAGALRCIEATGLWVHVDAERGVPAPLPAGFHAIWGKDAGNRRVSARLRHDPPPADVTSHGWPLRATDLDVVGHVNNAAYWAPVEQELARRGRPRVCRAEIEFRAGLDEGDDVDFAVVERPDGFACWLRVGGDVRASMLLASTP